MNDYEQAAELLDDARRTAETALCGAIDPDIESIIRSAMDSLDLAHSIAMERAND